MTDIIPGLLTPETTPTKNLSKASSSETSPSTSSSLSSSETPPVTTPSPATETDSERTKSSTETSEKQTVETDSPEHKRSAPTVDVAASSEKDEISTKGVSKDGSGDNEGRLKRTEKEQTATKAKPPKSGKSRKSRYIVCYFLIRMGQKRHVSLFLSGQVVLEFGVKWSQINSYLHKLPGMKILRKMQEFLLIVKINAFSFLFRMVLDF